MQSDEKEETRPVHVEIDCSTGKQHERPLTDEEWAQQKEEAAAYEKKEAEEAAAEESFRAQVLSHPDPVVQELARRAGVI